MQYKLVKVVIIAGIILSIMVPAYGKDTVWWKDTSNQRIPSNKWTYLQFDGKTTISKKSKGRALYCTQVHFDFRSKKPRYVKVRFARQLEKGKLDTTGTTTWVLGKNAPARWQGSTCWPVSTTRKVTVQVKVGGSGTWTSTLRQFKVWAPKGGFDDTAFISQ